MMIAYTPSAALYVRDFSSVKSTAESFKSWDTCMDNKTCKIVVFVLIGIAGLLLLYVVSSIIRCLCCGITCFSSFCCCFANLCSCCGGSSKNFRSQKESPDQYPPLKNHGYAPPNVYTPQSPMVMEPQPPEQSHKPSNYSMYTRRSAPGTRYDKDAYDDLAPAPLPDQVFQKSSGNALYDEAQHQFGENGVLAQTTRQEQPARFAAAGPQHQQQQQQQPQKANPFDQDTFYQSPNDIPMQQFNQLPDAVLEANRNAYERIQTTGQRTGQSQGQRFGMPDEQPVNRYSVLDSNYQAERQSIAFPNAQSMSSTTTGGTVRGVPTGGQFVHDTSPMPPLPNTNTGMGPHMFEGLGPQHQPQPQPQHQAVSPPSVPPLPTKIALASPEPQTQAPYPTTHQFHEFMNRAEPRETEESKLPYPRNSFI